MNKYARRWETGIEFEITFWDDWFKTKGSLWPDEYTLRLTKRDIPQYVQDILNEYPQDSYNLLDVGSGPLTSLGNQMNKKTLTLTAVDPLADLYNKLYDKYKVNPIVKTQNVAV